MIHLMQSVKPAAAGFFTTFLMGQVMAPEHVQFTILLAGGVGVVVGAVKWIDTRIEDKLTVQFQAHEAVEALQYKALDTKIDHLKEMLKKPDA